jgi:glycosyltransferase involved in cell wall biosynthesis
VTGAGATPTLSVVLPIYNASEWAPRTIERVDAALRGTPWEHAQVVAVDDGSTDGTGEVLDRLAKTRPNLDVVHTENRGRLLARKTGLDAARGELVLLIDCRVFLDDGALRHVASTLETDTDEVVWNGHVVIDTSENPYARFWEAVTFVAWRRYLARPRPVHFGADDFDYYPKGTGCFIAPRELLLESYDVFSSLFDDPKLVNDDTSLLRHLASEHPIRLDPGFSCVYHARGSLKTFLEHGYFRGIHFVDGYLDPSTRYFKPLVAFLALTPVGVVAVVAAPKVTAAAGAVGLVITLLTALALRVRPRTALWFTLLAPVFAAVYGAGIWRGVWLMLRARGGRS